ncbi:amino acid ABC transporter permease [Caballeronia sp. DA-9]|uniref:amino acid ABC transporter permease n=1 Tax=Caballeronia sp. DA-9 TaxID=3436237 RepID=UPI003F674471
MRFDFSVIIDNLPLFLHGALVTLGVTVAAFIAGYAMGIVIALLDLSLPRPLRFVVRAYIEVLRSIPFIILMFIVHYGLPFAGIRLPSIVSGVGALALFASVYYAEIISAALAALPRGQYESARTIGMSPAQAMRHVVVPQILRALVPPSTNMTLTMMKESAVLSSVTIPELSFEGLIVQGNTFAPFEVFAIVAVLYWIIAIAASELSRRLEKRLGLAQAGAVSHSALAQRYLSLDKQAAP